MTARARGRSIVGVHGPQRNHEGVTVPATAGMTATTPDLFSVLERAAKRWDAQHPPVDPPAAFLEYLAAHVRPLVDTAASSSAAAMVEHLRAKLAAAKEQLAGVRADTARQVDRAVRAGKATAGVLRARVDELRLDVAAARRDRDQAVEHAADAALRHDTDQRVLRDLTEDRDRYRALLARLVDAINAEWHPEADPVAQVDRAVALVAAAAERLGLTEKGVA